uniref:Glutathione-dependent formaldehyde-activating, GFA n=1 Tax=Shewanella sp. (strain MR-7) TaxID=60481 RepID=Q0HRI9_SHESR
MQSVASLEGGCLCGAIRYRIEGKPFDADYCHCRMCQKSIGAVFGAWMDFKLQQVTWVKGQVTEFASSECVRRGFCAHCGCSLTYRHTEYPDYLTLTIASLDDPELVQPNYHIYTDEQPSWLKIEDNCQRYPQARTK